MKLFIKKVKYILDIILNYLKSLLVAVFSFFFDIFKKEKNVKNYKPIKLDNGNNNNNNNSISKIDDNSGHNEKPSSKIINNTNYIISKEDLEKLILEIFCKELEIEEKELSKKEKEYIDGLNEKIIPILKNDITKEYISNEFELNREVKKLIVEELEQQFNLEQIKAISSEEIIITPIIIRKKDKKISKIDNTSTFLDTKIPIVSVDDSFEENLNISSAEVISSLPINNIKEEKVIFSNGEFNLNASNADASFSSNINNYESVIKNNDSADITSNIDYIVDSSFVVNKPNFPSVSEKYSFRNETNEQDTPFTGLVMPLEDIEPIDKSKSKIEVIETKIEDKKEEFQVYDIDKLDSYIQSINLTFKQEVNKEELEDKNYDLLEKQINILLNEINKLKLMKLNPTLKNKLIMQENKLIQLKNNLSLQKLEDIGFEEANLNKVIPIEDLEKLENELEKLHLDDKLDLQSYMLHNLEELDNINTDKAKKIEKELLKIKLKKAFKALELPSLLALPFIHNKYFLIFTGGLFANHHLKLFDAILKRKTINFEPEELSHIRFGSHAFDDAILISKQNIEYLNYLETEAFRKYPELRFDAHYNFHLYRLKNKLLKQQERLLKKEALFQKHNLKIKRKIRKLEKK